MKSEKLGTQPGKSVCLTWIANRFYSGCKVLDVYNVRDLDVKLKQVKSK